MVRRYSKWAPEASREIARPSQGWRLLTWARRDRTLLSEQGRVRDMRFARTRLGNGRLGI